MIPISLNGKFVGQRLTGVQRFARETVLALDRLLELPEFHFARDSFTLIIPGTHSEQIPVLSRIKIKKTEGSASHKWEQITLPFAARGSMLINLSGSSPLLKLGQVVTLHDTAVFDVPSAYSTLFKIWYRFAFYLQSRIAKQIFTVSQFSKSRLCFRLGTSPSRISVIPNGCEHILREAPDPTIMNRMGLSLHSYFLAVGSRNPSKNFARLIKAFLSLPEAGRPKLVVVGGSNSSVFAGPELQDRPGIVKAGHVSDGELRELYTNSLAFIFPSIYEGFGIPPLEAMSCGAAVAAARAASIPEVCGDAAIYFDPFDPSSIAQALHALSVDSTLRQAIAASGVERSQAFTWELTARTIMAELVNLKIFGDLKLV